MYSFGDARHIELARKRCTVDSSQMGRLSKSVFLVVLLLLAGAPGFAPHLCAMSSGSHAHACCMGHNHQSASLCGTTKTLSENSSCGCKVVPFGLVTVPSMSPSVRSHDVADAYQALSSVTLDLPVPTFRSNRGSPHSAPLRHSPTPALLCTFLV